MQSMQTKPNIPNPLSPCIIMLLHSFSHWSTSNFGAWLLKNEKGTTMSCFNIKVVAICALTNDDSDTAKTRYNSIQVLRQKQKQKHKFSVVFMPRFRSIII